MLEKPASACSVSITPAIVDNEKTAQEQQVYRHRAPPLHHDKHGERRAQSDPALGTELTCSHLGNNQGRFKREGGHGDFLGSYELGQV